MSSSDIYEYISTLIKTQKKIRIIIEGPPLCGKTTTIKKALKENCSKWVYLSAIQLFSERTIQTQSIIDRHSTSDCILFIDNAECIFPSDDPDFSILQDFVSKKPNVIFACRDRTKIHPFILRYFDHFLKMERPKIAIGTAKVENVTFDDIGGCGSAKELVRLIASWSVANSSKISEWGLKPPSGAILYGPPGTGKTLLAKAAANECGCSFFAISIPDLLRSYVGESEKRLTETFEHARSVAPSIVFIDEIQALFGRRSDGRNDGNRLVVQLISQLDTPNPKNGAIICLAATNELSAVDSALLRPGRFEEVIEVGLPNCDEIAEIAEIALRSIPHSNVDIKSVANKMVGLSPAEIRGVIQKAALEVAMSGGDSVDENCIVNELRRLRFSPLQ